jgi:hypothetical protein
MATFKIISTSRIFPDGEDGTHSSSLKFLEQPSPCLLSVHALNIAIVQHELVILVGIEQYGNGVAHADPLGEMLSVPQYITSQLIFLVFIIRVFSLIFKILIFFIYFLGVTQLVKDEKKGRA